MPPPQSGDRRYLYHQGNEQTTWRRSEGGRQALVNIEFAPPAIPFDTIVTGLGIPTVTGHAHIAQ